MDFYKYFNGEILGSRFFVLFILNIYLSLYMFIFNVKVFVRLFFR